MADLEPRLDKAMTWTAEFVDPARTAPPCARHPTPAALAALAEQERRGSTCCSTACPTTRRRLETLTALIYGVPKLGRGMALDDPPTDEVKADQKAFFRLLYNLLVDAERGPRLPTLFLALGAERVRSLLGQRAT